MKRIPLYVYVAMNNPKGAASVITNFGLMPPRNQYDVVRGLRHVMMTKGEDGFREIAKVHPDRQLIMDANTIELDIKPEVVETKTKTNINGADCSTCRYSNANGDSSNNAPDQSQIDDIKKIKLEMKMDKEALKTKDLIKSESEKLKELVLSDKNKQLAINLGIAAGIGVLFYMALKK